MPLRKGYIALAVLSLSSALVYAASNTFEGRHLIHHVLHRGSGDPEVMRVLAKPAEDLTFGEIRHLQSLISDYGSLTEYQSSNARAVAGNDFDHIVLFGDSMAALWKTQSTLLQRDHRFVDRGIGGNDTRDLLMRFEQDVVQLRPSRVVIEAGTNDILQWRGPVSPVATRNNIVAMLDIAKAYGIPVILATAPPIDNEPALSPMVVAYNDWLRREAASRSIPVFDVYAIVSDGHGKYKSGWTIDGTHPTANIYGELEGYLLDIVGKPN